MARRAAAAGLLIAALGAWGAARADRDGEGGPGSSLWSDPVFQKQFLGTYGAVSELEPRLSQIEREQLEKIMVLMGTDLDAAAAALAAAATPQASAVFDFTLGNVHFQKDRLDQAAACYLAAVAKFPAFRRAHKNLGMVLVRLGKSAEAIRPLSRVIELGGGDGLTYGLLGYSYSDVEQYTSAAVAFRSAVLLQPDVLDWKVGLAQCVLKQRQYGEALTLSEELLRAHPERTEFWLMQASAYLGLGQPLEAAKDYEMLHRLGKTTPQSLFTLGDIYVNAGLYDAAVRSYRQAISDKPDQPVDRPIRSIEILAQRNAFEQAADLAATVKGAFADRLEEADRKKILRLEARIAVAAGGDTAAAVTMLEEIVALDPLDGDALMLLGQHYNRTSDPDRALFYYERAQGIEAYEADARVRQAQILVGQSKFREAVPLLKRAQEIKPRDEVAKYLEQVERLARARS
jgi:tetratricopeptide (TPR) repeat protein